MESTLTTETTQPWEHRPEVGRYSTSLTRPWFDPDLTLEDLYVFAVIGAIWERVIDTERLFELTSLRLSTDEVIDGLSNLHNKGYIVRKRDEDGQVYVSVNLDWGPEDDE